MWLFFLWLFYVLQFDCMKKKRVTEKKKMCYEKILLFSFFFGMIWFIANITLVFMAIEIQINQMCTCKYFHLFNFTTKFYYIYSSWPATFNRVSQELRSHRKKNESKNWKKKTKTKHNQCMPWSEKMKREVHKKRYEDTVKRGAVN